MKIEVSITKKRFFTISLGILLLVSLVIVIAYGTNNPSVMGHSGLEIDATLNGQTKNINAHLNDLYGNVVTLQSDVSILQSGAGSVGCSLAGEVIGTGASSSYGFKTIVIPSKCIDTPCRLVLIARSSGSLGEMTEAKFFQESGTNKWTTSIKTSGTNDNVNPTFILNLFQTTTVPAAGTTAGLWDIGSSLSGGASCGTASNDFCLAVWNQGSAKLFICN